MPTGEEMDGLMAAVAAGDRQAFTALFEHFAPRVATYLIRLGAPSAVAEELAQEAMVVLWRKAGTFDPDRGAVSTWLFAIARNLRIDRHRQFGNQEIAFDLSAHDIADEAASQEERLQGRTLRRRVIAALAQLPAEHARLLRLSYLSETPHPDIARELHLPLGTVKSRIQVALKNLRLLLEKET